MSKKFYIGICCLALLATSVASAYNEDFEGYTGNVGDPWDGTAEFPASGWGDLYRMSETWTSTAHELSAGYNTTQGVAVFGIASDRAAARLLPAPQGPNSTFVFTAMVNANAEWGLWFGADELAAGPQDHADGLVWLYGGYDSVQIQWAVNSSSRTFEDFVDTVDYSTMGWMEHKMEADTDANARPTTVRYYYRDLEEDGTGPAEDWQQVDINGTAAGSDLALDMDGDNWTIDAIGMSVGYDVTDGVYFDNFNATPEPVTLAILGIGGLLALIRRRRG